MINHIEITSTPIDITAIIARMNNLQHGALDIFIGKVRANNQNREVVGIEYEVFEALAKITLNDICAKVRQKVCEDLDICVIHHHGYLAVGGISILIIVGSRHRHEAFVACRELIEEIKHNVPIWKQEHYCDGKSEWVKGHTLCQH